MREVTRINGKVQARSVEKDRQKCDGLLTRDGRCCICHHVDPDVRREWRKANPDWKDPDRGRYN